MTQQMTVTRNEDGSHSPAYDENWPEAVQLEWHAGIVAVETGLRIQVQCSSDIVTGVRVEGDHPDTYRVTLKGPRVLTSYGAMEFRQAWSFLDGVRAAVQASQP
jgi:hypothetical protein